MTDLISIGASGVKAYTSALATVGDNIANSQSPGFVRRAIRTSEVPAGGDVVLFRNQIRPGGALANGVTRAVDTWLVEDSRVAEGEAGRSSSRLNWLESAERTIDDTTSGVGANMTGMFNAADRLTSNPSDTRLRSAFLQSADDTAAAFRRSANGLERTSVGIQTDAQGTVTQLNTDLTALEHVNAGLRRARDASTNQATLMDERDRLLDSISSATAITTEFDARGVASVRLASPSNEPLVAAGTVNQVSLSVQGNATLGYALASGGSFVPTSGKLAGLADAAVDLAGRRSSLDTLAIQFSTDFNAAHQAGSDAQGNPGVALFNLSGGTASSLTAISLDPDQVAAANSDGGNGNLLSMASLRGPTGGEAGWAALAASQSQAVASARAQDAAASTRRDGAQSARADVSAVDLDHEAAELLRFQQAYQGSARVLQVARETMQAILNAF
jgi:flagellar hook-associated protein 1